VRRPSKAPWVLLAAWWLSACATTPEGPVPEGPIIDELKIQGASKIDDGEIEKKILTTESSGILFLRKERRLDPNAWQADLRRIERLYQTRGYYQARVVEAVVVPSSKPEHVSLRVRVEEGEPTLLAKPVVKGLEGLAEEHRAKALDQVALQEGKIFLESDWQKSKDALRGHVRELGYAEATVEGEVEVDLEQRRALPSIEVKAGPRYKFGQIFVATDSHSQVTPSWIVEQAQSDIKPGAWYSEKALAEAQARVFKMGVFAAVKVTRGAPDREAGVVPIVVDVREAPFHTLRAGGGVGIDQTRNEARLLSEYTHRNFLGGLRRYTLRGRVGYAFIPDLVQSFRGRADAQSGAVFSVLNEFEQPRFLWPTVSFQTSLELSRGLEIGYGYLGGTYKAGVVWRPRSDLAIFPSYNLDVYSLSGNIQLGGRSPAVAFGCDSPCVLSYLEQTIQFDRRDSPIEPRAGYYLAFSVQEGGGPLQGAFTYVRLLPEVRGYFSVGENKDLTFAARTRAGWLLPRGGGASPIVARFFSGGSTAMRGFNSRRLAPQVVVPRVDDDGVLIGETIPIGGDSLFEASGEVRYNVWGDLVVAAFSDAGLVSKYRLDFGDLQVAVGTGVRYRTPLGPIRLDLAYRLPVGPRLEVDPSPDAAPVQASRGCFGIGGGTSDNYAGYPEGLCSFHLSIGEAF
jgi:translocation and assembly module TamA